MLSVVLCPVVGGALPWSGGGLSWCRCWSVLVSVVAPVGVLPPPGPAVSSPSLDGVRRLPPPQPSDDKGFLHARSLLKCVGGEDTAIEALHLAFPVSFAARNYGNSGKTSVLPLISMTTGGGFHGIPVLNCRKDAGQVVSHPTRCCVGKSSSSLFR